MGCSSPAEVQTFNVFYCSLNPVLSKKNTFKIELIAQEEIEKIEGAKLINQLGKSNDSDITRFLEREKFQNNTLFYFFLRKEPVIKNFSQSLYYQPFNLSKLFKIVLLSIDNAENIPSQIIEKQTKDLTYYKFEGQEINFDDLKERINEMNNPNITKDNLSFDDNNIYKAGEDILVDEDEIILCDEINKESLNSVKENLAKGDKIKSVKIFNTQIENISLFIQIIGCFKDRNIQKFAFFDNTLNIDFDGWESICQFFDNNYSIRFVDLHNSNIYDNHLVDILRSLSDKRIRLLNLSKNFITIDGAKSIGDFIRNNRTLQRLILSQNNQNNFKSEGVKIITESLMSNPNIKLIDFSYMHLTGCGQHIGNFISNCKSIESIILKDVKLNAIDFKNIFESIKNSKSLKEIDVSMNDMGGDKSLQYIADSIKVNKSLDTLKIDKININNDNYQIIFDAIENAKNITTYSINYNSNIRPKIVLDFFIRQRHVKTLYYEPFDKNNNEDRKKELTLDDKKLFEKIKNERSDMKFIYKF